MTIAIGGGGLDGEVLRRRHYRIGGSIIIVEEGPVSFILILQLDR